MHFQEFIKKIDTLRVFKHNTINKIVISALKCGNRFMEESNCFEFMPLDNITINDFKDADEIFWIVREPKGHFISALITELQVRYNSKKNTFDSEKEFILNLIETKLSEIIEEPMFTNQFSHYQPRYELLHSLLKDDVRYFYNSKFIELKDLSKLLEEEFSCKYDYKEYKYSLEFGDEYRINKKIILELLETNFKKKWNKIEKTILKETEYYSQLSNVNFLKNFINRIDVLDSEITDYIKTKETLTNEIEKIKYDNLQHIIAKDQILMELNAKVYELNARLGYVKKTFI